MLLYYNLMKFDNIEHGYSYVGAGGNFNITFLQNISNLVSTVLFITLDIFPFCLYEAEQHRQSPHHILSMFFPYFFSP